MTIGILYVGIGRYIQFWDQFYASCEKYFLPQIEKKYFVFSDHSLTTPPNVKVLYQEDLGWPKNVLYRYRFFLSIKEELKSFDYLFFFNGNTEFLQPIYPEIFLPNEKENFLTGLVWYINEKKSIDKYPYERRNISQAYIPYDKGTHYFQAGIIGGRTDRYIELLEICDSWTEIDLKKDIVPIWHDESYLNKYLLGKQIKILTTEYGRPQQWSSPRNPKIIFRNKNAILGKEFMRRLKEGDRKTPFGKFIETLKNIYRKETNQ